MHVLRTLILDLDFFSELSCSDPGDVKHVQRSGGFAVGQSLTFTCIPHYVVAQGDLLLKCGQDGQWIGELPVCIGTPHSLYFRFDCHAAVLNQFVVVKSFFEIASM